MLSYQATAIYQAKQKLVSIGKANDHPISSEELIKYSHRISASHAVAAPYNWEVGDQRRPYPTDMEMRAGLLGQQALSDQGHASMSQHPQQTGPFGTPNHQTQIELPRPGSAASASSFSWQSQDIKPSMSAISAGQNPVIDSRNKENVEDVEVMSTDSSSSSSSDSQ